MYSIVLKIQFRKLLDKFMPRCFMFLFAFLNEIFLLCFLSLTLSFMFMFIYIYKGVLHTHSHRREKEKKYTNEQFMSKIRNLNLNAICIYVLLYKVSYKCQLDQVSLQCSLGLLYPYWLLSTCSVGYWEEHRSLHV